MSTLCTVSRRMRVSVRSLNPVAPIVICYAMKRDVGLRLSAGGPDRLGPHSAYSSYSPGWWGKFQKGE